jgi:hypothetical protein
VRCVPIPSPRKPILLFASVTAIPSGGFSGIGRSADEEPVIDVTDRADPVEAPPDASLTATGSSTGTCTPLRDPAGAVATPAIAPMATTPSPRRSNDWRLRVPVNVPPPTTDPVIGTASLATLRALRDCASAGTTDQAGMRLLASARARNRNAIEHPPTGRLYGSIPSRLEPDCSCGEAGELARGNPSTGTPRTSQSRKRQAPVRELFPGEELTGAAL